MLTLNHFFKQAGLLIATGLCSFGLTAAEPGEKPASTSPAARPPAAANPAGSPATCCGGSIRPTPESALTDDQRAELRKSTEESREKVQSLDKKIREASQAVNESLFAEPYDDAVTRQKAAAVGQLEIERLLLRTKVFDKVRSTLTAAQRDRLKRLPIDAALAAGYTGQPPSRPVAALPRSASGAPQAVAPGTARQEAPASKPKDEAVK